MSNFNKTSYGTQTLEQRHMSWSANTVYGQLGVQMGADKLVEGAERFGFNQDLDFPIVMYTSLMADPSEMTEWETAWAAAGEPVNPMNHESPAGPQATVLQMAMVGSAIANDGVEHEALPGGWRVQRQRPAQLHGTARETAHLHQRRHRKARAAISSRALSSKAPAPLRRSTAWKWPARRARPRRPTATTAGSWAWRPQTTPRVVVAVVIEDGDEGVGTQKAHDILQTALEVQGLI